MDEQAVRVSDLTSSWITETPEWNQRFNSDGKLEPREKTNFSRSPGNLKGQPQKHADIFRIYTKVDAWPSVHRQLAV